MKTLLLIAFSFVTALAPLAHAAKPQDQDQDQVKQPKKQQRAPSYRPAPVTQVPKVQRQATVPQQMNRAPHVNPVITRQQPKARTFTEQDRAQINRLTRTPDLTPRVRPNPNVVRSPQTTATVQTDVDARRRSDWNNRNRSNNNWQNRSSNSYSWEQARRRHHRQHRHRSWWRSHYTRFALFGTGYYFWDSGYWYPAYGYDPSYNTYAYEEPIYGYNDLEPAQVIASVQTELQRLGYYRDAVDGQMGPNTRAAIANYQRDNGLAITSAIDQPTLGSLGLD